MVPNFLKKALGITKRRISKESSKGASNNDIEVKDLKRKVFKEAVKGNIRLNLKVLSELLRTKWCRKSTVLNMIARRIEKTSGDILLTEWTSIRQQARCIEVCLSEF